MIIPVADEMYEKAIVSSTRATVTSHDMEKITKEEKNATIY